MLGGIRAKGRRLEARGGVARAANAICRLFARNVDAGAVRVECVIYDSIYEQEKASARASTNQKTMHDAQEDKKQRTAQGPGDKPALHSCCDDGRRIRKVEMTTTERLC